MSVGPYYMFDEQVEVVSELLNLIKTGKYSDFELYRFLSTNKKISSLYFSQIMENVQSEFSKKDLELLFDFAYNYSKDTMYQIILNKLLSFKSNDDAINYMISIDYTPDDLYKHLWYLSSNYDKHYSNEDYERLVNLRKDYQRIMSLIKKTIKSENDKLKRQKELEVATQNLKDALLNKTTLTPHDIALLKDNNNPLLDQYFKMREEKRKQIFAIIINKIRNMVKGLKEGIILEDGTKRAYDIADYHLSTKLSFNQLEDIAKIYLSPTDYLLIKRFVKKYEKAHPLSLDKLYAEKQVFNAQFDSDGNMISGREITKYEKENIVIYMKNKGLPMYREIYNALFLRWKKGYLEMPTKFMIDDDNKTHSLS